MNKNVIYRDNKKLDTTYPTHPIFNDISGMLINGLKIIRYAGRRKNCIYYECECHCGEKFISCVNNIKNGTTKSCGCTRSPKRNTMSSINSNIGIGKLNIYRIYQGITYLDRGSFYDKNNKLCSEWEEDNNGFANFYNWAINNGYVDGMNLLRKDPTLPYSPKNCILVDSKLSTRFHSDNYQITINNYTYPLSIWADITGISKSAISRRINICGWSERDAVLTPVRGTPGVDVIDYIIPPEYEILNGCGQ